MDYKNIRNKTLKFYKGGMIPKYDIGGNISNRQFWIEKFKQNHASELTGLENDDIIWNMLTSLQINTDEEETAEDLLKLAVDPNSAFGKQIAADLLRNSKKNNSGLITTSSHNVVETNAAQVNKEQSLDALGQIGITAGGSLAGYLGGDQGALGFQGMVGNIAGMAKNGFSGGGLAGAIGGAMNMTSGIIDLQFLGDKNFSQTSLKIDSAVHAVSSTVAGIVPWGTLAAGILESVNMATKAGGSTVLGYDVNINSSGYSLAMAHLDSSSSRGWLGFDFGNTDAKLLRRNEKLRMAMTAAQIAEDNTFEQEARMNSVENTIMNNQIALAGGLQTNLLAG